VSEYVDPGEVVGRFPGLAGHDEADLIDAIVSASSWIDTKCGRKFSLAATATPRTFATRDVHLLHLRRNEIGDPTVTIATDDGTGTFATTLAAGDFQLEPTGALDEDRPFLFVRRLDAMWPYATTRNSRQERIKITARWGWPKVPDGVREACLTLVNDRLTNPANVQSESYDDYRVVFGQVAVRAARQFLGRVQRPLVA
jgi:hypothetical protein